MGIVYFIIIKTFVINNNEKNAICIRNIRPIIIIVIIHNTNFFLFFFYFLSVLSHLELLSSPNKEHGAITH